VGLQNLVSYLDTNIHIFLHSGNADRLSHRAIEQFEGHDLLVSSMVLLELEILHEKGAIRYLGSQIVADLNQQIGVTVCQLPMAVVMSSALEVKWTRRIRAEYKNAVW